MTPSQASHGQAGADGPALALLESIKANPTGLEMQALQETAGVSRITLRKWLDALEERRLINRVERPGYPTLILPANPDTDPDTPQRTPGPAPAPFTTEPTLIPDPDSTLRYGGMCPTCGRSAPRPPSKKTLYGPPVEMLERLRRALPGGLFEVELAGYKKESMARRWLDELLADGLASIEMKNGFAYWRAEEGRAD